MVYVAPVYFRVPLFLSVRASLLILGLIGIYSLLHITLSQRIIPIGPRLGAVIANGLLVVLYFLGATRLPVVGHGAGELAAVTFLATSLVIAGLRAVPGCEVMAIPGVFFRKNSALACLIFSLLAKLEPRLRSKRDAPNH